MSSRHSNQENSSIYESNRSRRQQPTPSNQQEPLHSSPSHSDQASKACCFCWCWCCSCSWYVFKYIYSSFLCFTLRENLIYSVIIFLYCGIYCFRVPIVNLYIIVVLFFSISLALDVGLLIIAH